MQTDPVFTDGRSAVLNPVLTNMNVAGQTYEYLSDSIDRDAIEQEHSDADGSPLGSDTREGFEKGSITVQLNLATDVIARPSHVLKLQIGNGDEFYIAGKFGRARTRNQITKGAIAVKKAYNPIISNLLDPEYGQRKNLTQAAGVLAGALAAAAATINTRTGGVLAYTMAAAPGSAALPGWLTCSPTTGGLSGTAVVGAWVIDIVCTETLAGQETRVGFGRMGMIIT
ncbi:MAG: hypothetical protein H7343_12285 [Undibacterium sp.]|nr:hypothetical protein [Opitutaceae bacterium]